MSDILSEKTAARLAPLVAPLLFLLVSFFYCRPLLQDLTISCRGDWDYFSHLYQVPSITLFEYGQIPLWNPYCGGGMPLVGNPQLGFPSPISLLTSLFGVLPGLKLSVWLHTFLGLLGSWLVGGHLRIRGPARFAPPFIFMFCTAWPLHLAEGHIVWLPASLIPFVFLGYLQGVHSPRRLVLGAVWLSLMIYEGGTYVLATTLLFLAVYAFTLSLGSRSWRPLLGFIALNVMAAGFSAPKMLPVLSLMGGNPRPMGVGGPVPWIDLVGTFIDRYGSNALVNEGCYVGIVVAILYLVSLFRVKGHLPLVVASLSILAFSMGNFAAWAPWTLLHKLPLFGGFQAPMRSLIVFCFAGSLLVGLLLGGTDGGGQRWMRYLVGLVVLGIATDLFLLGSPVLADAVRPVQMVLFRIKGPTRLDRPAELYHVPPAQAPALGRKVSALHAPFCQVRVPDLQRFAHGGWSDQYPQILHNKGVVDAYETLPFAHNASAATDPGYRGEYHLEGAGAGQALLKEWTPNTLRFRVALQRDDRLVVNQNFFPGWRASRGVVEDRGGLLSVPLKAGEYDLEIEYLPMSFLIGMAIFAAAVSSVLFLVTRRTKRQGSRRLR